MSLKIMSGLQHHSRVKSKCLSALQTESMSSPSIPLEATVSSKDFTSKEHFADGFQRPRCSACHELIYSGEYTRAMGKDWHKEHFTCWQCNSWLTAQRYVVREEHQLCLKCFEQMYANVCEECTKPIGIETLDLCYEERHWHQTCFNCLKCHKSLVDLEFGTKGSQIYCGQCFNESFGHRCDTCGDFFQPGTKITEYKGKKLHENCFKCFKCQLPIDSQTFVPEGNDIFCAECYKMKHSTRCVKCSEIISGNGLVYRDESWHPECFKCFDCDHQVEGSRFAVKEDRIICLECYASKYADKCHFCQKGICGRSSATPESPFTKFVTFKGRKWHELCFKCSGCHSKLESKGFLEDGNDLLCHVCAEKKFAGASGGAGH